jgi:uncharacterized protein with GYD domain
MPLYAALGRTTPVGAADLRGTAERYDQNRAALEANGARIIAGYACLGQYDFLFIVEAPDNETAMRLSALTASRGTSQYETMPIIPIERFFEFVQDIDGPPDKR